METRHRGIELASYDPAEARKQLSEREHCVVLVPDLSGKNFELDGACACFDVKGVRVVHVFYRRTAPEPAVLSFFTVDHRITLKGGRCARCGRKPGGVERDYRMAESDGVRVCAWNENEHSYAICGEMEAMKLRDLVDEVRLAAWKPAQAVYARGD